jgi:hypothetical protein
MNEALYAKWLLDTDSDSDIVVEGYIKSLETEITTFPIQYRNAVIQMNAAPPHTEIKIACTETNKKKLLEMQNCAMSGQLKKILLLVVDE